MKQKKSKKSIQLPNDDCYYMDSAMRMDDVHEFMRKSAL